MSHRPGLARPARLARLARTIRVTAGVVAVLLLVGIAGAFTLGPTSATGGAAAGGGAPSGAGRAGTSSTTTSLPPNTTLVTGSLTSARVGGATGPPLSLPLEINVPVRGRGSATFYNVVVGGQPSTVVWQGEVPLDLEGHGSIVPGRADVALDANGSTWQLDGAERVLSPGSYKADAPVAVGRAGLAQPENSAMFQAGANSILATSGGAAVQRAPMALHLVGPGSLDLTGTLTVVRGNSQVRVRSVHLAQGSYVLDVSPQPGGLDIHVLISGSVTTGS